MTISLYDIVNSLKEKLIITFNY